MPLPTGDIETAWPPLGLQNVFAHMREWSAWYSNSVSKLQEAYGGGEMADTTGFFASDAGGFKPTIGRRLERFFVGQRVLGPNRNMKMPPPVAAMMCQAVADLLYAEPPTFTIRTDGDRDGDGLTAASSVHATQRTPAEEATQARLNELCDEDLYTALARAAETGAALGGSFLRVVWDKNVIGSRPFLDVVDADQAVPEFVWGQLRAVTFWNVVARSMESNAVNDGKSASVVWRHLERHELSGLGVGVIWHGLYRGDDEHLGAREPLTARPETAFYADLSLPGDPPGFVSSLTPGLAVEYVPNLTPSRIWRTDPIGRWLGRSSLDGVEHLLDQLVETMSDWMRAQRAAKARVFYDKSLLGNPGPGQGAVADLDQETYVGTTQIVKGPNTTMSDKIQVAQPKYDPSGYQKTAQALIAQILQTSGFSTQTFGMDDSSLRTAPTTATEIEARERLTFLTRNRFIRTQTPHLKRVIEKLLAVDKAVFGTPNIDAPVWVTFPDSAQESMLRLAQTVQTLVAAEAASRDQVVRILHPDWNDDQWDIEVEKLAREYGAVTDPTVDGPEDAGDAPAKPNGVKPAAVAHDSP